MMEEFGKAKGIKSWKSSYGCSFNESMICYNDEQEAETAIVEISKYRGWIAELYQSYFQKQYSHKQNNIQQQDATQNNTQSNRQSTSEMSEKDNEKDKETITKGGEVAVKNDTKRKYELSQRR